METCSHVYKLSRYTLKKPFSSTWDLHTNHEAEKTQGPNMRTFSQEVKFCFSFDHKNTMLNSIHSRYLEETTVHGFRYVVEGDGVIERLIWVLVILCSFCYATNLIGASLQEWTSDPIATTFQKLPLYKVTLDP